jgi:hypothetical protein
VTAAYSHVALQTTSAHLRWELLMYSRAYAQVGEWRGGKEARQRGSEAARQRWSEPEASDKHHNNRPNRDLRGCVGFAEGEVCTLLPGSPGAGPKRPSARANETSCCWKDSLER